jgi:putative CocE/NonD family hydrolase
MRQKRDASRHAQASRRRTASSTAALVLRTLLSLCVLALALVAPTTALAETVAPPPTSLPPASYPTTFSEQRFIRMDDGVELGATITFPSQNGTAPAPGHFPVVLNITPYGRDGACACENATNYATRGFVLAVVDVRGTGGSQGNLAENYFSRREAKDGYDLVEFLGTQPWSNGKVGMSGGSYLAIMEYLTAEEDPSHLAAIVPDEGLADIYNDAAYPGGILSLFFDSQYLGLQGTLGLSGVNTEPSMIPGTLEAKYEQATGRSIAFDYLENPYEGPFYYERSPITRVANIRVPVFVLDGWRDAFVAGDIRMFEQLERRSGVETLLNVGPCTHKGCGPPFYPTSETPGIDNIEAQELQFFERHLMGIEVPSLPRVRVYDQQAGQYVEETAWPPPTTKFQREYLSGEALVPKAPAEASASYLTDPAAGLSMTFDQQGTVAITPYIPINQRVEEEQGLTWRTPALSQPLTLDGPIAVHLVASSSATNTDWFAKVSDVAPGGEQSIVAEGQLRASLRALARGSTAKQPLQMLAKPEALEPGRFYDYEIAIAPTAYEFAAGHRLQVRLTSYNMPNALPGTVDFNGTAPATSSFVPLPPATNTVRFGGTDGSSLLLPVAPAG